MENIFHNPVVLKIHNGTVRGDANLCRSCRFSHRTVGAITGTETVVCMGNYHKPVRLQEPMAHCTLYVDKNRPTLDQMHEIAWTLMTDKGGRKIGFQSPEQRREDSRPSGPIGF